MYINPDIYNPENLNKHDKARLDCIEQVKQTVLNSDVVEDFIESKEVSGETLKKVYRDILNDFTVFLQERTEYCKVDLIVDAIEGYSDAEFENICLQNRQAHKAVRTARSAKKPKGDF